MYIAIAAIPFLVVSFAVYIKLLVHIAKGDHNNSDKYIIPLSMTSWITLTSVLSFSIWRIRHFSAMLAQNKIFANEKLMLIHLVSFSTIAICAVSIESMVVSGALDTNPDIDTMNDR